MASPEHNELTCNAKFFHAKYEIDLNSLHTTDCLILKCHRLFKFIPKEDKNMYMIAQIIIMPVDCLVMLGTKAYATIGLTKLLRQNSLVSVPEGLSHWFLVRPYGILELKLGWRNR